MKKNIFKISFLSTILLFSCQKDEIKTNQTSNLEGNTSSNISIEKINRTRPLRLLHFYDAGKGGVDCINQPGNCLPDVVITPSKLSMFNSLWNVLITNNQVLIKNYFIENSASLLSFFDQEDINGVINSSLKTETINQTSENQNPSKYILFKNNSTGEIDFVYPIVL